MPDPQPVNHLRLTALTAVVLTLTGCMLGPDYIRPDTSAQLPADFKIPSGWKIAEPADQRSRGTWWKRFGDARLNGLMNQAVTRNLSLRAAYFRVEQARAIARLGRTALQPDLTFQPSAERRQNSATTRPDGSGTIGSTSSRFELPLVFDYELDLWGRLRRELEAAEAESAASAADYQNVLLSLQADLATIYYSLRALDREIEILREGLALRKKSLELNQRRFEAGDLDEVDVSRAETEVSATESDILGLLRTRAEFENALAVLTGAPSSTFHLDPAPLVSAPPHIPTTVPSALLERRPDVASAERTMQAANARIGAACAAFYPTVRLSAGAGLASGSLDRLLDSDSSQWNIVPAASLPLLDGGRNKAEYARSTFRHEETVALYRQTVLNAVREVDDALTGVSFLSQQLAAQERTVVSAQRTVDLSQQRYDAGLVAFFDVVDAQRTALDAQRTAARLQGTRHLAAISLVKALGGGWD